MLDPAADPGDPDSTEERGGQRRGNAGELVGKGDWATRGVDGGDWHPMRVVGCAHPSGDPSGRVRRARGGWGGIGRTVAPLVS